MNAGAAGRVQEFWEDQTVQELAGLLPKVQDYGSFDLELIGDVMRRAGVNSDMSNVELGIAFYLVGKIARIASAITDGHAPSSDTYHDISVYARMALYARIHGGVWP